LIYLVAWGSVIRDAHPTNRLYHGSRHCRAPWNDAEGTISGRPAFFENNAAVEILNQIPPNMHVVVTTDSACVKKGTTEWMANWIQKGWRNSQGAPVANRVLWKMLIKASERHIGGEWSWTKAHSGKLLNECPDTLAIRGPFNTQRPNGTPQTMVPTRPR
jgi:ribonuclease HI